MSIKNFPQDGREKNRMGPESGVDPNRPRAFYEGGASGDGDETHADTVLVCDEPPGAYTATTKVETLDVGTDRT